MNLKTAKAIRIDMQRNRSDHQDYSCSVQWRLD